MSLDLLFFIDMDPFASHGHSEPTRSENPSLPKDISLSVNYLPSKFASSLLSPGAIRHRGKSDLLKCGGGREAFKSNEPCMPAEEDEDYDGMTGGWFGEKDDGHTHPRMWWNRFKWMLFVANVCVCLFSRLSRPILLRYSCPYILSLDSFSV